MSIALQDGMGITCRLGQEKELFQAGVAPCSSRGRRFESSSDEGSSLRD